MKCSSRDSNLLQWVITILTFLGDFIQEKARGQMLAHSPGLQDQRLERMNLEPWVLSTQLSISAELSSLPQPPCNRSFVHTGPTVPNIRFLVVKEDLLIRSSPTGLKPKNEDSSPSRQWLMSWTWETITSLPNQSPSQCRYLWKINQMHGWPWHNDVCIPHR